MLAQVIKDFDVLENLVREFGSEISQNSKLILVLIGLAAIDIIIALIRMVADFRLKNKEKAIHSFTLKEKTRIDVLTKIYFDLDELGQESDPQILLQKVTEIERYVNRNSLYIRKGYETIISNALDYFKSIMTSPRKKNYQTEMDFMKSYRNLFDQ